MKSIVIDKDIEYHRVVEENCNNFSNVSLVAVFNKLNDSIDFIMTNKVDIIFLDIDLGNIDAFEVLNCLENPPLVIIITSNTDFILRSYEYWFIIDYLKKPFSQTRFIKALAKARKLILLKNTSHDDNTLKPFKTKVKLKVNGVFNDFIIDEIFYIKSVGNYVHLFLERKSFMVKESLVNILNEFRGNGFIQIHRSYLINLNKVNSFDKNIVNIVNKDIPIGNSYKQKVFEQLAEKSAYS